MEELDGAQGRMKQIIGHWGIVIKLKYKCSLDLKRQTQRSLAGRHTSVVCEVQKVLRVVNDSIVSNNSLIIKIWDGS